MIFQKVAFGLQNQAKTHSRPKQTTQKEARKCKPKASLRSGRQCPQKNSCPLYLLVYLFRAFWVLLHPLKVYWIHTNRQFTDEVHGAVAFFPVRSRTFLSTRRIFSVHILVPENMFQIFANTAFYAGLYYLAWFAHYTLPYDVHVCCFSARPECRTTFWNIQFPTNPTSVSLSRFL